MHAAFSVGTCEHSDGVVIQRPTDLLGVQETCTVEEVCHQVGRGFLRLKWRELVNIFKPFCFCKTERGVRKSFHRCGNEEKT